MYNKSFSILFALAFALPLTVNAHSLIIGVEGANGVTGQGFGVVDTTPRDGRDQTDSTRVRGNRSGACGRTENGVNDIALNMAAATAAGLPSVAADGTLTMTMHQVNGDGAGPYTCEVSTDGTGATFQQMTITTQVDGRNGRSRNRGQNAPLVAQMPAGVACTGGPDGNACLVRCTQRLGFGGCTAVTMDNANNANNADNANNNTNNANDNANNNANNNAGNNNANDNAGNNNNANNAGNNNDNANNAANNNADANADDANDTADEETGATGNANGNANNANAGNTGNAAGNGNGNAAGGIAGRILDTIDRLQARAAQKLPVEDADDDFFHGSEHDDAVARRIVRSRIARGVAF